MIRDYRKAKKIIKKPDEKRDRELVDWLRYRELFGKKRSDDTKSDLAIAQWEREGKACSKWLIK